MIFFQRAILIFLFILLIVSPLSLAKVNQAKLRSYRRRVFYDAYRKHLQEKYGIVITKASTHPLSLGSFTRYPHISVARSRYPQKTTLTFLACKFPDFFYSPSTFLNVNERSSDPYTGRDDFFVFFSGKVLFRLKFFRGLTFNMPSLNSNHPLIWPP